MPGVNGFQVLAELKSDPEMRSLPVVVLTTSDDERDIEKCYEAGANSYIVKPVGFGAFMEAMARMKAYWLELVVIPKPND